MSLVAVAIYLFLWVLALNGASNLTPLLVVPLVLAVLVAFGVWLNRFMGISPRAQHFAARPEEVGPATIDLTPNPPAPAATRPSETPPIVPESTSRDGEERPTQDFS